jgi:hypothetical protein
MGQKNSYLVGNNAVPITLEASWETFDGGKWEFCCSITVDADGRSDDSIRWSDVTASDLRKAFEFLDSPEWPKSTPPEVLIGAVDNLQIIEIAHSLSKYAKESYPSATPAEGYFGI